MVLPSYISTFGDKITMIIATKKPNFTQHPLPYTNTPAGPRRTSKMPHLRRRFVWERWENHPIDAIWFVPIRIAILGVDPPIFRTGWCCFPLGGKNTITFVFLSQHQRFVGWFICELLLCAPFNWKGTLALFCSDTPQRCVSSPSKHMQILESAAMNLRCLLGSSTLGLTSPAHPNRHIDRFPWRCGYGSLGISHALYHHNGQRTTFFSGLQTWRISHLIKYYVRTVYT
jgi:hypothetical protein